MKRLMFAMALAAALMTTPAHAADADIPSCTDFRTRLAAASQTLEVYLAQVRTFRNTNGDWDVKIGNWNAGTLHCDGDKFGQLVILTPAFHRE